MKLLIEIDEHSKNVIDQNAEFADGTGCDILPEYIFTGLIESVKNGSVIPDNATNEDVVNLMFPNGLGISDFHWWKAPYRKD